jgi:tungstate transport system substrate-binding protein
MKRICMLAAMMSLALLATSCIPKPQDKPKGAVRVAVIGGMTMTGMWQEVSRMFERETGYKVEVVKTGPRPDLAEVFRAGQADLLTMHSGDVTTDLVADGYGTDLRPWTKNDLVIVGPPSDPAGIKGMTDGAAALRRIAEREAPFVDFHGIGSRELTHNLWRKAGVEPQGEWVLKDESKSGPAILQFARDHNAYVIVGRMPVLFGKMQVGDMQVMVEGDPAMRRPYVVMEASSERFPQANHAGARALADFLLSEEVQKLLAEFGTDRGELPLFHPLGQVGSR